MNKMKPIVVGVFALVLIIIKSFTSLLNFITDYQWFKEIGYETVFLTKLLTQIKIGIPVFVIITILLYIYLISIKKDYYKKVDTVYVGLEEKRVNQIALGTSAIISFFSTITMASNLWFETLKVFNSTAFNVNDPIFNNDISFYIFKLPFITQIYSLVIGFILLLIVVTLVFYFLLMGVRRPTLREVGDESPENVFVGNFNKSNGKELLDIAIRQISVLGFLFFIVLGFGYFIKQFDLLYSPRGVAFGASYTDVNITLWMYRAMIVLSFVSAILFAIGMKGKKYRLALTGPVLMIVVTVLGNSVALGVQNFIVSPDEISKERQYLEYNIEYTKLAYGIDKIEEKSFLADLSLTKDDIQDNIETIENIRINDYRPTKQFYDQRQGIRLYYKFNDVDVDRYMVNGKYTQVFLAGREIDETKINNQWINQHLKYSHGYGVALSPVNAITSTGQPVLLIENIPPQSQIEEIQITRPEIYFGELTNNYIISNTKEKEFDYPSGDSNAEVIYEGSAGIPLSGMNRLLFAIKESSMKMLVSTNITSDSKILINRNIRDRVRKIAPFITYDNDPYLVISEGELYWIIDGYTTSSNYPYAKPYVNQKDNYIRNSVKVVVNAYNGDTKYYVVDKNDPVIMTMGKIFPDLLTSVDEMPAGIKSHIRYPQALFDIQAFAYKTYHMNDINVFYQGEDLWDIANEIYEREVVPMESNYIIMQLPGEEQDEFILSIPYTPKDKPNMTALLVVKNDGEDYGKLIIYKMPKQKTVYGPMQIESKIDQDTNISKEFSLWGQQGSTYIRGNLLSIPIKNSFLYIEPIYLKADNENSLPEVKRVVAVYGDKIAYESTLDEALEELFGKSDEKPEYGDDGELIPDNGQGEDVSALVKLANEAYLDAEEARIDGDWAAYGKYLEELESILKQLENVTMEEDVVVEDQTIIDETPEV